MYSYQFDLVKYLLGLLSWCFNLVYYGCNRGIALSSSYLCLSFWSLFPSKPFMQFYITCS